MFKQNKHHPTLSAFSELKKHHPDRILVDGTGRNYGVPSDNPVLEDLKEKGEVDQNATFLWWVRLPRRAIDPDPSASDVPLEPHEAMNLPVEGERIAYRRLTDQGTILGEAVVEFFPEDVKTDARAALVVVRLS